MAINHKYAALTAIFILAAVLSAQFVPAYIWGATDNSLTLNLTSSPANNIWYRATTTNNTLNFTVQFVSNTSSAFCYLNTSLNGAAYLFAPNITSRNATLPPQMNISPQNNLFWNDSFSNGGYQWNIVCRNETLGLLDFYNQSAIRTLYYDTVPTNNVVNFPSANIVLTSLTPSPLQANVVESLWNATNITSVWHRYTTGSDDSRNITLNLSLGATNVSGFHSTGAQSFTNVTFNVSWTFGYYGVQLVNYSGGSPGVFSNFSDIHQQPGVHSVTFCSNDTIHNINCSIAQTYNILVANASAVIEHYRLNESGVKTLLSITNETEAALSATDLMLLNAKGNSNYTLTFNRSNRRASLVGVMFDNISILNITNFNITVVPSPTWVTNISNQGFNLTINNSVTDANTTAWLDIPGDVGINDYKYVQFNFTAVGEYDAYFYCNGSTSAGQNPACYRIQSRCNANEINFTAAGVSAIPLSGCYNSTGYANASITIYSRRASGVALANDTFAPNSIVNNTATNFRSGQVVINVTITDRNGGMGVNTTIYYRWQNASDSGTSSLFALSNTTASGDNIFNATLNTTTLSDGLYTIIVNATDNAIVPNRNDSFSFGLLRVDNTAPTNSSPLFPNGTTFNFDNFTVQLGAVLNDTFWNATNINTTRVYVDNAANITLVNSTASLNNGSYAGVAFNASMIHSFNSTDTNPGPHTAYIYMNDTIGNGNTINHPFIIRVANATQVKNVYDERKVPLGATINITRETNLGRGTPIGDDVMTLIRGTYNYSIMLNRSNFAYLTVFGMQQNYTTINSIHRGNNLTAATNANWTTNMTGQGFNLARGNILWTDLNASFVNSTDYKFGQLDFTTWHDGYFYCNGTWNVPSCYELDPCGSRPNVTSYATVIPSSVSGCYVRSGQAATVYTLRLSGGGGANDTTAPAVTIDSPINGSSFNDTVNLNATVQDTFGGSGVNASSVFWRYELVNGTTNSSWYNLTNTSSATEFTFSINRTLIADGNYSLRINASDNAANANVNTSMFITGIVFDYTNPSCTITQLKTDTITVGEALTASDFKCTESDNIGPDRTRTAFSGLDTSSAATRDARCTVYDTANNTASCTVAFTVYTSGGGGGAGGGGGGSIGESSSSVIVGDIAAGVSKSVTGFDSKSGVEQITIETTQLVSDAKVTVASLSARPSSISASPEGQVYKYIDIKIPEVPSDSAVKKAEIAFKVEKKWLVDNNLDMNSVRLTRFKTDTAGWQKLTTTLSKQDSTYAYYHAETPGFSTFAVVAEKTVTGAPAVEPKKEEVKEAAAPIPTPAKKQMPQWAGIVALLAIIAVIAYFVTQKKGGGSSGGSYSSGRWKRRRWR